MVGWLASIILRTSAQLGIWANVVAGVVGSYLATLVAQAAGFAPYGRTGDWVVAALGATLLIASLRALGVFPRSEPAR